MEKIQLKYEDRMTVAELRAALDGLPEDDFIQVYSRKYNESVYITEVEKVDEDYTYLISNDEAWSKNLMSELSTIDALETTCIEDYPTCTECEHYDRDKHYCPRFCQVIKDTLAEAQPKKGKWVFDKEHSCTIYMYKCSNCNCLGTLHYKYCPNCGAEMSGGGEE